MRKTDDGGPTTGDRRRATDDGGPTTVSGRPSSVVGPSLPVVSRLSLWDDLCQHEEDVPVPQWHKDLLDERARKIEEGTAQFRDWETAKKRIAETIS